MEVIVTNGPLPSEEQKYYEDYIAKKYGRLQIQRLLLTLDGDYVNIRIEPRKNVLTKIGGTLISNPLTWNDAKRAEYFDTVPHAL